MERRLMICIDSPSFSLLCISRELYVSLGADGRFALAERECVGHSCRVDNILNHGSHQCGYIEYARNTSRAKQPSMLDMFDRGLGRLNVGRLIWPEAHDEGLGVRCPAPNLICRYCIVNYVHAVLRQYIVDRTSIKRC
jgi:hypothetical protein